MEIKALFSLFTDFVMAHLTETRLNALKETSYKLLMYFILICFHLLKANIFQ